MPFALLPMLLVAPPIGTATPADVAVTPHRATIDRMVQQRQDDGFFIIDRDLAPPAPAPVATATVTLGAHVGLDRSLVEGRGFPCGGTGR